MKFEPICIDNGSDSKPSKWIIVLTNNKGVSHTFYYQMGSAHRIRTYFGSVAKKPEYDDVMFCLVNDAVAGMNACYEDFSSEYGYDLDSREGERVYMACKETWLKMRELGLDIDELVEKYQDY